MEKATANSSMSNRPEAEVLPRQGPGTQSTGKYRKVHGLVNGSSTGREFQELTLVGGTIHSKGSSIMLHPPVRATAITKEPGTKYDLEW